MMEAIELEAETDENGELRLTKEQLGNFHPHTHVKVRVEAREPESKWETRWAKMAPEERAKDFLEWVEHFKDADTPELSDWAVSRDSIYD